MMVRFVVAIGLAVVGQAAQTPARDPLFSVRHLSCSFPIYAAPVWKDGAAEVVSRAQDLNFDIDSIETKKNSARIVGAGGATAHASTVVTSTGINVIEATQQGNLNITTIFVAGGPAGKYLAVHSRHIGDPNSAPTVSQNYGTCAIVP
jgi:hypothetical protein